MLKATAIDPVEAPRTTETVTFMRAAAADTMDDSPRLGGIGAVAKRVLNWLLHTRPALSILSSLTRLTQYRVFAPRTVELMRFDLMRLRARMRMPGHPQRPASNKLHFGCGSRIVPGWLNVDVDGTEQVVDLASGALPWAGDSFDVIVGQQVIEHLELFSELLPLLHELHRIARPGAEVWVSCPDLEKVCRSYFEHRGADMVADRLTRPHGALGMDGVPSQHMINNMFQQSGEHRNLFDLELLAWALARAGFTRVERVTEGDFLARHPEFPCRNDDYCSLYVRAIAGKN
jgi:predicted SAM-dependent methyltransferase